MNKLATELYFSQPQSESEREIAGLSDLAAAELHEKGMAAMSGEGGVPAPYFETILERHPSSRYASNAKLQLGILYVRNCEHKRAVQLLEEYLHECADSTDLVAAQANFFAGMARSGLGEREKAAQHYESALRGFPVSNLYRATALSNLGELYLLLGKEGEAVARFEQLIGEFAGNEQAVNMVKRARQRIKELEQ